MRWTVSWCELDLTSVFVVMTLTIKIFFGLCLEIHKVKKVDTW